MDFVIKHFFFFFHERVDPIGPLPLFLAGYKILEYFFLPVRMLRILLSCLLVLVVWEKVFLSRYLQILSLSVMSLKNFLAGIVGPLRSIAVSFILGTFPSLLKISTFLFHFFSFRSNQLCICFLYIYHFDDYHNSSIMLELSHKLT